MEGAPLRGTQVVVTRATDQASKLIERLDTLGAEVVAVPTIAVAEPADGGAWLREALDHLDEYDWLVVTSANGAERVALHSAGKDIAPAIKVGVIGPGTADALARHGIVADLVPDRFVAEGLLEVFPAPPEGGGRVLLAQAAGARPVLAEQMAAMGWQVDRVDAYRTMHPDVDTELADQARSADVVTFTSASTVAGYVAAVGTEPAPRAVVCIGPVTAAAARSAGLDVDAVADPHSIDGLVDAVVELVDTRRG